MSASPAHPISQSLQEYGRGLAGGLIFSLPLLYTMEVWQAGAAMRPGRLLVGLGCTFLLLMGYNRFAGLRQDASILEVLIDSVEELGLGLAVAALVLLLIGQLRADMRLDALVGTITLEGLLAAIGVSVGTAQLGGDGADSGVEDAGRSPHSLGNLLVLSACGAVLIGANVAPTEEIRLIAASAGPWALLGVVALALALCGLIGFFSEFAGSDPGPRPGPATMLRVTLTSYAVALAASAGMLWFFGQLDGQGWQVIVSRSIVLSLAAALGASAGRLLLQQ